MASSVPAGEEVNRSWEEDSLGTRREISFGSGPSPGKKLFLHSSFFACCVYELDNDDSNAKKKKENKTHLDDSENASTNDEVRVVLNQSCSC